VKQTKVIPLVLKPKVQRAPAGLGKSGRRLWKAIQESYAIDDPGGVAFLVSACRAEDDIIRMRTKVAKDGDTLTVTDKPPTAHPLLAVIRGLENIRRQSLRALNLDLEPLHNRPGRPGGSR
jgi:hypothetical protein